jgi:hypothetical protein
MACDGHIDEREIKEIKAMDKSAAYFQGIDLSVELESLLVSLKEKGKHIVDELFEGLNKLNISTIQELLILEVAFRLIYADTKVDENEIKFLRFLRSKLKVPDIIIKERFGMVEYLFDRDYSKDIVKENSREDLLGTINIPKASELKEVDLSGLLDLSDSDNN